MAIFWMLITVVALSLLRETKEGDTRAR